MEISPIEPGFCGCPVLHHLLIKRKSADSSMAQGTPKFVGHLIPERSQVLLAGRGSKKDTTKESEHRMNQPLTNQWQNTILDE